MIPKSIIIHDLVFTNTFFFRRNIAYFSKLLNITIPSHIQSSVQINKIYPIKFGPFSPIYFCKVKEILQKNNSQHEIIRCIVYILQTDYKRLARKNVIGRNQFLTSTKMIQIPTTLFCVLASFTEWHNWNTTDIMMDELTTIKDVNILMVPFTHFLNYCAYRKATESNAPFRRLGSSRSRPAIEDMKLVFFDCSMTVQELIKQKRLVSYTDSRFNINTSFLSLKTQSPTNLYSLTISNSANSQTQMLEIQPKRKRGRPSAKPKETKQEEKAEVELAPDSSPQSAQIASTDASLKRTRRRRLSEVAESPPRKIKTRSSAALGESNESEVATSLETIISSPEKKFPRRSTRKNAKSKLLDSLVQQNSRKKPKNTKKAISPIDSVYEQERTDAGIKLMERWASRQEFNEEYIQFFHKRYNQAPRAPKMGWTEIDFYTLFSETVKRGGYRIVTSKQLWKDVYKELNSNNVVSNAATTIRVHYAKLMRGFEDAYFPEPFAVSQGNDTANISGNSDKQEMYNVPVELNLHSGTKFTDFNVNSILRTNEDAHKKNPKPIEHRPHYNPRNYSQNCYNYPPNYCHPSNPMYYGPESYGGYPHDYYGYYPHYPSDDYYNHYQPMYPYADPSFNQTPYNVCYNNGNGVSHPPTGMQYPYPPPLSTSNPCISRPPYQTNPKVFDSRHQMPNNI